ncbi:hypothetical protein [Herbaspirillum sp. GW103]|jgi:hypothetical protein|uniref:hypothetical protein n=1 Tax=Herbaspirillum sp. GW103 TaxID=1175306 RepID=UPI0005568347|nr:hypothetical protein [Herbaspirillum sp. GW103]
MNTREEQGPAVQETQENKLILRERMNTHPKLGVAFILTGVTGCTLLSQEFDLAEEIFILGMLAGNSIAALGALLVALWFDAQR